MLAISVKLPIRPGAAGAMPAGQKSARPPAGPRGPSRHLPRVQRHLVRPSQALPQRPLPHYHDFRTGSRRARPKCSPSSLRACPIPRSPSTSSSARARSKATSSACAQRPGERPRISRRLRPPNTDSCDHRAAKPLDLPQSMADNGEWEGYGRSSDIPGGGAHDSYRVRPDRPGALDAQLMVEAGLKPVADEAAARLHAALDSLSI